MLKLAERGIDALERLATAAEGIAEHLYVIAHVIKDGRVVITTDQGDHLEVRAVKFED